MAPQSSQKHTVVIELESQFSDGSREHWPRDAAFEYKPHDDYYNRSLASQWMGSTGQTQQGMYTSRYMCKHDLILLSVFVVTTVLHGGLSSQISYSIIYVMGLMFMLPEVCSSSILQCPGQKLWYFMPASYHVYLYHFLSMSDINKCTDMLLCVTYNNVGDIDTIYTLSALPEGYATYTKSRKNGTHVSWFPRPVKS